MAAAAAAAAAAAPLHAMCMVQQRQSGGSAHGSPKASSGSGGKRWWQRRQQKLRRSQRRQKLRRSQRQPAAWPLAWPGASEACRCAHCHCSPPVRPPHLHHKFLLVLRRHAGQEINVVCRRGAAARGAVAGQQSRAAAWQQRERPQAVRSMGSTTARAARPRRAGSCHPALLYKAAVERQARLQRQQRIRARKPLPRPPPVAAAAAAGPAAHRRRGNT